MSAVTDFFKQNRVQKASSTCHIQGDRMSLKVGSHFDRPPSHSAFPLFFGLQATLVGRLPGVAAGSSGTPPPSRSDQHCTSMRVPLVPSLLPVYNCSRASPIVSRSLRSASAGVDVNFLVELPMPNHCSNPYLSESRASANKYIQK